MTSCVRWQTADELSVTLYWKQMMEIVQLVSDLFKQCTNVCVAAFHIDHSRSGAVYNFGRVCLSVRRQF